MCNNMFDLAKMDRFDISDQNSKDEAVFRDDQCFMLTVKTFQKS